MNRTRIKICGLTREEDVDAAVAAGADAVGFVIYQASPRYVSPARAAVLAGRLPPYVTPVLLSCCGLYVWLTGWSHVAIQMFGVSPQNFGYTFLLNGIGLVVTSQAVAHLGGLYGMLPFTFVYCALIGVVNSTGGGLAMAEFGHSAGMASALMGMMIYAGGFAGSLAMGAMPAQTPVPMALLMCLCGLAALVAAMKLNPLLPAQPSAKPG